MRLGVFHPECPMAYIIPVPYLRIEAQAILINHARKKTMAESMAIG